MLPQGFQLVVDEPEGIEVPAACEGAGIRDLLRDRPLGFVDRLTQQSNVVVSALDAVEWRSELIHVPPSQIVRQMACPNFGQYPQAVLAPPPSWQANRPTRIRERIAVFVASRSAASVAAPSRRCQPRSTRARRASPIG